MDIQPIIRLPSPRNSERPTGSPRNPPKPKGPGSERQLERFEPTFRRLTEALEKSDPALQLRDDPYGIAPERALVFVTAGPVQNFVKSATKLGLDVISEIEDDYNVPDEFEPPKDGAFSPILYATMPTVDSFEQMLSLWNAYSNNQALPKGFTPWRDLFDLLVEIRVWGPEDRLPIDSRQSIEDNLPFDDADTVKLEIEILPLSNSKKRRAWNEDAKNRVEELGGVIIDTSSISEDGFVYDALLIELTVSAVREMLDNPHDINGLATVEGIQMIAPQTVAQAPTAEIDTSENVSVSALESGFDESSPIRCALLDGTVAASHRTLEGGVIIEDINDLVRLSEVSNRFHATSMASLILRGELDSDSSPLGDSRLLNVPILIDENNSNATSPSSRLFVDLVHSTLLNLFSEDTEVDHDVFVVNFSIGIPASRYAGRISALGRLLDWWSYNFGVLFVISAGNIFDNLEFRGIRPSEFESSSTEEQQKIIREAIRNFSYGRTLLSPAESINGLTVGALSQDLSTNSQRTPHTLTLESENGPLPAISSALGLGKSKTVKPDVLEAGGMQEYGLYPSGDGSFLQLRRNSALNGLVVAAPGVGANSRTARSRGTSCAAALTTRALLNAAAALTQDEGPYQGQELAREDIALLSRALAVNSATWSDDAVALYEEEKQLNGNQSSFKSKENVAKHYGFGLLSPELMKGCTEHRSTLVGLGNLKKDGAKIFDVPLPDSLSGEMIGRTFRVTLAWFSPIDALATRYKMATLEAFCGDEENDRDVEWGLGFKPLGLDERITSRGSVWSRRMQHKRMSIHKFENEATLPIRVQCRDVANGNLNPDLDIRFAMVVSLEVESTAEFDIHEEISNKVKIRLESTG